MGKRLTVALAVFALAVVPFGIYVGGYLWFGELTKGNLGIAVANGVTYRQTGSWQRVYKRSWATCVFQPAGQVESWLRGREVDVVLSDE